MEEKMLKQLLNVVTDIKADQKEIKSGICNMEKRMDSMENRMDSMESRMNSMEEKVDYILIEQKETAEILTEVVHEVGSLGNKLDAHIRNDSKRIAYN